METTLSFVPMVRNNHSSFAQDAEYVSFEEVSEQPSIRPSVNFLEANTSEISIEELTTQSMRSAYMGKSGVDYLTSGFHPHCA